MTSQTELLHNGDYFKDRVYLNTAAEGLLLKTAAAAVSRYLDDKATGEPGRVALFANHQRTRELAARLFHVGSENIALISSTTEGLNTIAQGIDWQAGDEVVFTSTEFPSNMFPWVSLAEKNRVRTRIVHPRDGQLRMEDLLEAITPRTRLVTVSQVSYATGQHVDPAPVWEKVRRTRALLCVDATQACARVPVRGDQADFVIASTFKWTNSIHGAAIFCAGQRAVDQKVLGPAGWFSTPSFYSDDRLEHFHPFDDARRFHAGMPNFDSLYSLEAALQFHTPEVVSERRAKLEPLVKRLHDGLSQLDVPVLTPATAADRAGIVAFRHPGSAEFKKQLADRKIHIHADDWRVRAAIHWYNSAEDIDQYLAALRTLL